MTGTINRLSRNTVVFIFLLLLLLLLMVKLTADDKCYVSRLYSCWIRPENYLKQQTNRHQLFTIEYSMLDDFLKLNTYFCLNV